MTAIATHEATPGILDDYRRFIGTKSQSGRGVGFEPMYLPDFLFDFQRHLVEWSVRRGRAAIFADCGLGKGFRSDTPVLTPTGWRPIGQLSVGDLVVGSDGNPYPVQGVYHRGVLDVFRVRFSDGVSALCDADHLWNVKSTNDVARGKDWRTMSVGDLMGTDLRYGKDGKSRSWQIPLVQPPDFGEADHYIAPYLLGVLLGDGALSGGTVSWTKPDEEIAERVRRDKPIAVDLVRIDAEGKATKWSLTTPRGYANPVTDELRRLGLMGLMSHEKFIPDAYLFGSPGQRIELLQGLMDTDGYSGESPEFSSSSMALATGVVYLVQSLGGTARINCKDEPTYRHNGEDRVGRPSYRVTMTMPPGINPFFLPRKAEKFKTPSRGLGRWIDAIEPEGQAETVCIRVGSPDSLFVAEHFLVTHNTPMQLAWAENVVRRANKPVIILTPLAVSHQVVKEAAKFGIEAHRSADGKPMSNITVTNYERLHQFDPDDYAGAVLDEASAIKHWTGHTQKAVTRFLSKLPYRLLCTATPAPNDYVEMGTLSEALGELTHSDMLATFFRQLSDDEKKRRATADDLIHSRRLSWRVIQSSGQWVLRPHAFEPFWRWVSGWARACRKPSDLGPFDDARFVLPGLVRRDHTVAPRTPPPGWLFTMPAFGLNQERQERRRTIDERAELVAGLAAGHDRSVVWCQLNDEADRLEEALPGSVQVKGSQHPDLKEELLLAFLDGQASRLITKAKIAGLGLNLQHCAHVVTFVTHSYEQFYQCVRRCYRFGQERPVTLDVIATEGEVNVRRNMERKEALAAQMFDSVVRHMNDSLAVSVPEPRSSMEIPQWL